MNLQILKYKKQYQQEMKLKVDTYHYLIPTGDEEEKNMSI